MYLLRLYWVMVVFLSGWSESDAPVAKNEMYDFWRNKDVDFPGAHIRNDFTRTNRFWER